MKRIFGVQLPDTRHQLDHVAISTALGIHAVVPVPPRCVLVDVQGWFVAQWTGRHSRYGLTGDINPQYPGQLCPWDMDVQCFWSCHAYRR